METNLTFKKHKTKNKIIFKSNLHFFNFQNLTWSLNFIKMQNIKKEIIDEYNVYKFNF